ncbi:Rieske (2Fe-2S) protein [candidate division KSB1 bacterium]
MSNLIKVAEAGSIPENSGIEVEVNGRPVALFNKGGEYLAVDNACPHEGEALSQGELIGEHVECAYHQWRVNLKTGETKEIPGYFIPVFKVKVIDNDIYIEV